MGISLISFVAGILVGALLWKICFRSDKDRANEARLQLYALERRNDTLDAELRKLKGKNGGGGNPF